MNKQESDILNALLIEPFINQRILAEVSGHSLGVVNRSLKDLIKADYLDDSIRPTVKAITEFKEKTPQRAIILAAGFGMRMVPINTEMPKGLLEVNGEPLIERIIKQLHEVGIKEIYVVVGFMKEKYEYLIDEYGVELVVNSEYAAKNNLHSLKLVKEHLENSYIVPCDIWCDRNPFHRHKTKIDLKNKSIFITGVAGFIGSNLAKRLLSTVEGVKVVGLDNMNNYYDVRLKEARLKELEQFEKFSFVKGNLADKAVIESIFEQYKPEIALILLAISSALLSLNTVLQVHNKTQIRANVLAGYAE